jgi:hypothetical protein
VIQLPTTRTAIRVQGQRNPHYQGGGERDQNEHPNTSPRIRSAATPGLFHSFVPSGSRESSPADTVVARNESRASPASSPPNNRNEIAVSAVRRISAQAGGLVPKTEQPSGG